MHDNQIDVCDGTPAHLDLMTDARNEASLTLPCHFILGGDTMGAGQVQAFFESVRPQRPTITNIYGVAECAVDSTAFDVTAESVNEFSGPIRAAI